MHLHEILNMKITDFEKERRRIEILFQATKIRIEDEWGNKHSFTYKQVADVSFTTSKIRGTALDITDFIDSIKEYWAKPSLDALLFYCEVIFNISMEANDSLRSHHEAVMLSNQLVGNIRKLLDKTGYEFQINEDGVYFITQKNAIASDVILELEDKHLALAILEYNRFSLKGDIDRKRELLNVIGQAVEPILKDKTAKARCPEVYDDVRFALNRLNIRHNNVSGANEQPAVKKLSQEELETAYDDLYSSMLVLLKISQLRDGHARIEALKKQMTKV